MPKKICFIITSRAQYARCRPLIELINQDPFFELQLVVGGQAIMPKFGEIYSDMLNSGYKSAEKIYTVIEGGDNISMAKTTGLTILEFTNILERLNPDIVLIVGDRFEVLAIATASAYLNKIIAHIEGGDVSGTIDESVRHAVTKLAQLHFTTNDLSAKRVAQMGENPEYIYNVGSLDIEFLTKAPAIKDFSFVNQVGVGSAIDFSKPYLMVMQHPVTTSEDNLKNIQTTLAAVHKLGRQAIWFWPNIDAGTDKASNAIRSFREENQAGYNIRFITHLPADKFVNLLRGASCLIGNSSCGIKESSYLGLPVVDIGTRQAGRLKAENVIQVDYDLEQITEAIKSQLVKGRYPASQIYYKPDTSRRIVEILKQARPPIQKRFFMAN